MLRIMFYNSSSYIELSILIFPPSLTLSPFTKLQHDWLSPSHQDHDARKQRLIT